MTWHLYLAPSAIAAVLSTRLSRRNRETWTTALITGAIVGGLWPLAAAINLYFRARDRHRRTRKPPAPSLPPGHPLYCPPAAPVPRPHLNPVKPKYAPGQAHPDPLSNG